MSYDLDKAHPFSIPFGGVRGDLGQMDFSAGSATLDQATTLSRCWGGFAMCKDNDGNNQVLLASTDGDVTNGVLTWRRFGGAVDASQTFWFMCFGV